MERPPEDEGPPREPYDEWLIDTLVEIQEEALKHFDRRLLHNVGSWVYERYGDSLEGVQKLITILQRALFLHFRYGCQEGRLGPAGRWNPFRSFPRANQQL
uniref:Protein Vpr n=1 Tax=Simian immunodeficiency virus TaxID=11723 RepID=A0A0A7RQC6_SIV|nr:vpr protein [Simian immunodeficiency virus]